MIALGCLFGLLAITFGIVTWRLFNGDKADYERNRLRHKTYFSPILGTVNSTHEGNRDYRVAAGLAVDLRKNQWVAQGRLSEEAIDSVLNKT